MTNIIIGFLILVFAITALCFVIKVMKQKEQDLEKDLESAVKQNEINANYNREIIKNEEKLSEIHSGNNLNNFNSGIELLHEQSEKGKKRNGNS